MKRSLTLFLVILVMVVSVASGRNVRRPKLLHLYVMDCGKLTIEDPSRFNFKKEELKELDLSVGCFLIAHPKGSLIWDTGVVPDSSFKPGAGSATKEYATATVPLRAQLAGIGYKPEDIQYMALSHYHWDHAGNASEFARSTWLITKVEHDALFSDSLPPRTDPSMFSPLRNTKTVFLPEADYDVFGDGTVVIKPTPGHTPGHRVLFLKLSKTGPIVLSGDLYHYPEELTADRAMQGEFNVNQTMESRKSLQAFLKQSGAKLWIQHDLAAFRKLMKAPAYYE